MIVNIEADGTLVIYPTSSIEEYAVKRWLDADRAAIQLRTAADHTVVSETHDVWEDGVKIESENDTLL